MATIDRMDYHYGGNFPKDLEYVCAGTHIGMYLAWIILNNLENPKLHEGAKNEIELLKKREITGREFLISNLDEKFLDSDLNEEGLAFTKSYYLNGDDYGEFIDNYISIFADDIKNKDSIYGVEDTWENYDNIEPLIAKKYIEWKKTRVS